MRIVSYHRGSRLSLSYSNSRAIFQNGDWGGDDIIGWEMSLFDINSKKKFQYRK